MDGVVAWMEEAGVLVLNGFLAVVYFLWEHGPTLLALVAAGLVAAGPDRAVERVAGHRPRRRGRGAVSRSSPVALVATGVTAAVWTGASFLSRAPVPLWGLVLWVALLLGTLVLPQERENVLWTHKALILGYGALAIGLRLLFQAPADVGGWSEIMGVEQGGAALLSTVRQALAPWVVIAVWALYPAGALALLAQRLLVNRTRLVAPMASVRESIGALRTRGEE